MKRVDEAWVLTEAHTGMFEGLLSSTRVKILENTSEDLKSSSPAATELPSVPRLLFLSNLLPEKGCFDLLDALEIAGERARGAEVRFVGEARTHVRGQFATRAARLAEKGVVARYDGVLTGSDKVAAFTLGLSVRSPKPVSI